MMVHHLFLNNKSEQGEQEINDDQSLNVDQLFVTPDPDNTKERSEAAISSNGDCIFDDTTSLTNKDSSTLPHKFNNSTPEFLNDSTMSMKMTMMKVIDHHHQTDDDDDDEGECYSIVLSRAKDPSIAEEWDSTWESLYTMDDASVYTSLTGQSSTKSRKGCGGVIIEGMPLLPSTTHTHTSGHHRSPGAQVKDVEDAIAHLSRCAADHGMNREELFEFIDFLMAQQDTDKGKRALVAAKKVLLESDGFLAAGRNSWDDHEEEKDHYYEEDGFEVEEEDDDAMTGAMEKSLSTVRQVNSSPKRGSTCVNQERDHQEEQEQEHDDTEEITIEFYREEDFDPAVDSDDDTEVYINYPPRGSGTQEMTSESEVSREISLPPLDLAQLSIPECSAGDDVDESDTERYMPWMDSWMPSRSSKWTNKQKLQQSEQPSEDIEFVPQEQQPIWETAQLASPSVPDDIDALLGQRQSFSPPVASTSFNSKTSTDETSTNRILLELPPSPPKKRIVVPLPSLPRKAQNDHQERRKRGWLQSLLTFNCAQATTSSSTTKTATSNNNGGKTKKMSLPSLFQKKSSGSSKPSGGKGLFSSKKQQQGTDANKKSHRRHSDSTTASTAAAAKNATQALEQWSFHTATTTTTSSSAMMTSGSEHTMDESLSEYSSARDWSLGGSSRGGGADHHQVNNNNNNYEFGVRKLGVVYEGRLFEC